MTEALTSPIITKCQGEERKGRRNSEWREGTEKGRQTVGMVGGE